MSLSRTCFLALVAIVSSISLAGCNSQKPTAATQPKPEQPLTQAPDPSWPRLAIPIECNLGDDCFIMHYVDLDSDPNEELDFGCGRQTYDGHKGTDFAVPDEEVMAEGIPVLASAAGTVLRVRDGVQDRRATDAQVEQVEEQGIECGNGMVIDHGNGWETQYCHLMNGSVAVQPETEVEPGDVLGMVGLSGKTQFPHIHLSLRYEGEVVDPFVGPSSVEGCNLERRPMWDRPIDYEPTGLIRAGFSSEQPTFDDLWAGRFSETEFSQDLPALIFWVHAYGVLEGDVQRFRLLDPDGREIVKQESEIEKSNRTWMSFTGKRNTSERPIVSGIWRGEYQLKRGNEVIFEVMREVEVGGR